NHFAVVLPGAAHVPLALEGIVLVAQVLDAHFLAAGKAAGGQDDRLGVDGVGGVGDGVVGDDAGNLVGVRVIDQGLALGLQQVVASVGGELVVRVMEALLEGILGDTVIGLRGGKAVFYQEGLGFFGVAAAEAAGGGIEVKAVVAQPVHGVAGLGHHQGDHF